MIVLHFCFVTVIAFGVVLHNIRERCESTASCLALLGQELVDAKERRKVHGMESLYPYDE